MASSLSANGAVPQRAEKRARLDASMRIMEEIRTVGYIPKRNTEHDKLAQNYQRAVKKGLISEKQKQEAEALTAAHVEAMKNQEDTGHGSKIMEQIRTLGHIPKRNSGHDKLVKDYQRALEDGKISPSEKEEAETLTAAYQRLQAETHAETIMEQLRVLGHWPCEGRQKNLLSLVF